MADPDRWEFGIFGGGHFFNDHNELGARDEVGAARIDNSFAFGLRLGFWLVPMLGLELEGVGMPTEAKLDGASSEQFIFGYRGSAVLQFNTGRIKPFLLAGGGGSSNRSERDDVLLDDTDFAFHAGLGLKIAVGDSWGIRLDGRAVFPPSTRSEGLTTDAEATIGLYKTFGGAQLPVDPDGDGILGDADGCPNDAEDKDGFQDDDGCPDSDNDGDGIPDASDKCPTEAETVNQIEDDDGCPEKDEDNDGIFGAADQCSTEAEDKDGFQDEDGCPDADNDADGILDGSDKCPDEAETRNGFEDEDGCADQVPAAVQQFTGTIQGINFKINSDKLTAGSSKTLDAAVAVLQQYPELRIEISGHTDITGNVDHNRDLSQRRADRVKEYMVKKGVAAERLESKGYGPDKPIATNDTKEGQMANRRVEFTLLSGGAPAGAPPASGTTPATAPTTTPPATTPAPTTTTPTTTTPPTTTQPQKTP
jgi:OOP family OmpA-OmpF porin